ncbi:MAG: hypothetical protein GWM98_18780, partial [Nitrospinaceae bacterium]|nr:hypothetical protein [Nitrospinaceae bacterium]
MSGSLFSSEIGAVPMAMDSKDITMTLQSVSGGITAPGGFFAAGVHAGIKADGRLDLGLLVSDPPAACAAVYTRNRIQGHHISLCRERLPGSNISAVWVNSGNANACNGRDGLEAAGSVNAEVASILKVSDSSVVNCSTGTIGRPFPGDAMKAAVPALHAALSPTG